MSTTKHGGEPAPAVAPGLTEPLWTVHDASAWLGVPVGTLYQ